MKCSSRSFCFSQVWWRRCVFLILQKQDVLEADAANDDVSHEEESSTSDSASDSDKVKGGILLSLPFQDVFPNSYGRSIFALKNSLFFGHLVFLQLQA